VLPPTLPGCCGAGRTSFSRGGSPGRARMPGDDRLAQFGVPESAPAPARSSCLRVDRAGQGGKPQVGGRSSRLVPAASTSSTLPARLWMMSAPFPQQLLAQLVAHVLQRLDDAGLMEVTRNSCQPSAFFTGPAIAPCSLAKTAAPSSGSGTPRAACRPGPPAPRRHRWLPSALRPSPPRRAFRRQLAGLRLVLHHDDLGGTFFGRLVAGAACLVGGLQLVVRDLDFAGKAQRREDYYLDAAIFRRGVAVRMVVVPALQLCLGRRRRFRRGGEG